MNRFQVSGSDRRRGGALPAWLIRSRLSATIMEHLQLFYFLHSFFGYRFVVCRAGLAYVVAGFYALTWAWKYHERQYSESFRDFKLCIPLSMQYNAYLN